MKRVTESIIRTQMQSLVEWADAIGTNKLIAVRVDRPAVAASADAASANDPFWLAMPTGAAFAAPENLAHSSDMFEEGWLIVPIKWYNLVPGTTRAYTLLPERVLLVVSTTVRLSGLTFTKAPTKGPKGQHILAAHDHRMIVENLSE